MWNVWSTGSNASGDFRGKPDKLLPRAELERMSQMVRDLQALTRLGTGWAWQMQEVWLRL
jgi:hypothetical protein